jgi:hypothetical protein
MGKISEKEWATLMENPANPVRVEQPKGCCGGGQPLPAVVQHQPRPTTMRTPVALPDSITLDQMFEGTRQQPGYLNEHMQRLKEMAGQCETVTELAIRPVYSTLSFLAGQPKKLTTYTSTDDPILLNLQSRQGKCEFTFVKRDTKTRIEATDLLFLDESHGSGHVIALLRSYAGQVKRWIVITGKNDHVNDVGPLHAVREFIKKNREWTVTLRVPGLTIMSRDDRDKKQPPGILKQALNFSKALAEHAASGMHLVDDATWESRLESCLLCEHRFCDQCGICGCPVDKRTSWAEQTCPDNPPRWFPLKVVS